jgi:hypothetical protein
VLSQSPKPSTGIGAKGLPGKLFGTQHDVSPLSESTVERYESFIAFSLRSSSPVNSGRGVGANVRGGGWGLYMT